MATKSNYFFFFFLPSTFGHSMQQGHQPIHPTQHSECLLTKSFRFLQNNQTIENFRVYNNKQIRKSDHSCSGKIENQQNILKLTEKQIQKIEKNSENWITEPQASKRNKINDSNNKNNNETNRATIVCPQVYSFCPDCILLQKAVAPQNPFKMKMKNSPIIEKLQVDITPPPPLIWKGEISRHYPHLYVWGWSPGIFMPEHLEGLQRKVRKRESMQRAAGLWVKDALLMPEVTGQWSDWLEMIGKEQ